MSQQADSGIGIGDGSGSKKPVRKQPRTPRPESPGLPATDGTAWPYQQLVDGLVKTYEELKGYPYKFNGKDGKALKELRKTVPPDVIASTWKLALQRTEYPTCADLPQLNGQWNALYAAVMRRGAPGIPAVDRPKLGVVQ